MCLQSIFGLIQQHTEIYFSMRMKNVYCSSKTENTLYMNVIQKCITNNPKTVVHRFNSRSQNVKQYISGNTTINLRRLYIYDRK